jgi:uncharacterized membrane protein YdjX (TVP38/TMEM64 family)
LARPAEAPPLEEPRLESAQIVPALLKAAMMMALLVCAGVLLRRAGAGALRDVHANARGVLMLVLAGGFMTAVGLPRPVLAFSAGFVFGAPWGIGWALLGQILGCALDYTAARTIIGGWARRHFAGRWRKLDRFIMTQPFTATLTLRLLPVGNNVVLNLLAGVTAVSPAAFLAASLLGYVPQTVIFALLGSGVHVGERQQLEAGVALFVASAALGALLWQRGRSSA